jgi:hypothetical protein
MPYLTRRLPARALTAEPLREEDQLAGVGGRSESASPGR